jgi:hypothetical protein
MDNENLLALIAATQAHDHLNDRADLTAGQRSTERQRLGAEIEERALRIVRDVRQARGVADDGPIEVDEVEEHEPEIALDGPFNPAKVRDAMLLYRNGFILPELVAALGAPTPQVKKWVAVWAKENRLEPTGYKVGHHIQYRYVPPKPGPRLERPRLRPPEVEASGAYAETLASGQPVRRPALERLEKASRSRSGVAHRHRQRDRQWERQQQASQERSSRKRKKKS